MTGDLETRDRLLAMATRLFADQGFRKVTVREICRAARANVAAVNYHFGDKEGLYREVVQQAIDAMTRTTDAARAAGEGRPPEEQLHRFLVIFLGQILKPENRVYHRLLQREIQDSTPVLDAVVQQGIRPRLDYLAGVVAEMTGSAPDDGHVMQCVGSINAQAIIYAPSPIAERLGFHVKGTPEEIESVAEHIAAFSIGGVRAACRSAGQTGRRSPRRRRTSHVRRSS